MYAKFVIYDEKDRFYNGRGVSNSEGNKAETVVPYSSHILEGIRMCYKKVAVSGSKEWYDTIEQGLLPFTLLSNVTGIEEDKPFEFIHLSVYTDDEKAPDNYVAAEDTMLFIMNDGGKTIDRVGCRNNH